MRSSPRSLPPTGPWDVASSAALVGRHAIPGVELWDADRRSLTRTVRVDGRLVVLRLELSVAGVEVRRGDGLVDAGRLDDLIRWWFDLDADVASVDLALAGDPVFERQIAERPGIRVVRYPDGFEAAITTVLGQQVSVAAGRTFAGRLAARYGEPAGDLLAFPTPPTVASTPAAELREAIGLTNARTRTLQAVADLFADGFTLPVGAGRDALEPLAALPGIGPWTVGYLAIRATSDTDALPASDAVLRRTLGGDDVRALERRAEAWRPYRSYASMRLWAGAG